MLDIYSSIEFPERINRENGFRIMSFMIQKIERDYAMYSRKSKLYNIMDMDATYNNFLNTFKDDFKIMLTDKSAENMNEEVYMTRSEFIDLIYKLKSRIQEKATRIKEYHYSLDSAFLYFRSACYIMKIPYEKYEITIVA